MIARHVETSCGRASGQGYGKSCTSVGIGSHRALTSNRHLMVKLTPDVGASPAVHVGAAKLRFLNTPRGIPRAHSKCDDGLPSLHLWSPPPSSTDVSTSEVAEKECALRHE